MDKDNIYFITGNNHKFNEVYKFFNEINLGYRLKQKNVETIEIQAESLKEVALFKLNNVKEKIAGSYFVEDSGFFVDTPLNGFPGVFSSYVFRTIGNEGLLKLITNFDISKAHFSSIISLHFYPLDRIFLFEGTVQGMVSKSIRGRGGFGFDPIFIPKANPNKTFAELSIQEKNLISHRGQALRKLITFLKENVEK